MTTQSALYMLRSRPWAAASLVALILAGYVALFEVAPRILSVARLVSQIYMTEMPHAQRDWDAEAASLERRIAEVDSIRSALEASAQLDGATTGAVLHVQRLADESRFSLHSVAIDRSAGTNTSLLVEGDGDYHAVGRLLDRIEFGEVSLLVRRLAISSAVNDGGVRAVIVLQPPSLESATAPEPR